MSTADPEIHAEQLEAVSSVAEELYEDYSERLLDFGHEVEAAGARIVDEEMYADRTSRFMAPEEVAYDLAYLVPVADQTTASLREVVEAVILDPERSGKELIGRQVLDSPHVNHPGETVVDYFRGADGWTAEVSYMESGETGVPESEQLKRFVSEVVNALDGTAVDVEVVGW